MKTKKPPNAVSSDADNGKAMAELLDDTREKLVKLKELRDLGIPISKLRENTWEIKNNLRIWINCQRDRGLTYQDIVDRLREENVMTMTGKTTWDTRTLSKIEKGKY